MPSKNCPAEIMPLKGITTLLTYSLLICHYLFLSNNDNNHVVFLQNYRPNCGFGSFIWTKVMSFFHPVVKCEIDSSP